MTAPPRARQHQAGVTLVEVLVALVIFSIIGVAGYAMLDLVTRTERLTEGRLQRLGQMQRAMFLINLDLHLAEDRSVTTGTDSVSFRRAVPDAAGGQVTLTYTLTGDALTRRMVDGRNEVLADQTLLTGVSELNWRYLAAGADWLPTWPPERAQGADGVRTDGELLVETAADKAGTVQGGTVADGALADGAVADGAIAGASVLAAADPENPRAVSLTLTLADGKTLTRVAVLPAAVQ